MLAEAAAPDGWALVVVALITAVPATISAINARKAKDEARSARVEAAAVNRAVNHRPHGDPSLYELVRANGEESRQARASADRACDIAGEAVTAVRQLKTQVTGHLAWHQADREDTP